MPVQEMVSWCFYAHASSFPFTFSFGDRSPLTVAHEDTTGRSHLLAAKSISMEQCIAPSSHRHRAQQRVLQDLYRYNYVVGESGSYLGIIHTLNSTRSRFETLREAKQQNKPPQVV